MIIFLFKTQIYKLESNYSSKNVNKWYKIEYLPQKGCIRYLISLISHNKLKLSSKFWIESNFYIKNCNFIYSEFKNHHGYQ